MKFRLDSEAIMSNSGWCDDPESKNYNQFVKLPVNESAEKLFRSDDLYDLIFHMLQCHLLLFFYLSFFLVNIFNVSKSTRVTRGLNFSILLSSNTS